MTSVAAWGRTVGVVGRGMEEGWHDGFQLAVIVRGEARGLCLGLAREGEPMGPATCCAWLSAGKPLTALLLARAVDRGCMGWDDRVSGWIPAFASGGKGAVTLRHLLTHTGGMRAADGIDGALGWEEALERACGMPLEEGWVPGVTAGYHARGSWLVLAEVACRALGGGFQELVTREVTGPLGVEGLRFDWTEEAALGAGRGWSVLRHAGPAAGRGLPEPDPGLGSGRMEPGAGLRGSATELARVHAALMDPPTGWLSRGVLAEVLGRQRAGALDLTFGAVVDMGLGWVLSTAGAGGQAMPYGYGPHAGARCFGHSGRQSACAFGDPDAGVAVAWCFNGMPGERIHQARQREVNAAVYEDLGLA